MKSPWFIQGWTRSLLPPRSICFPHEETHTHVQRKSKQTWAKLLHCKLFWTNTTDLRSKAKVTPIKSVFGRTCQLGQETSRDGDACELTHELQVRELVESLRLKICGPDTWVWRLYKQTLKMAIRKDRCPPGRTAWTGAPTQSRPFHSAWHFFSAAFRCFTARFQDRGVDLVHEETSGRTKSSTPSKDFRRVQVHAIRIPVWTFIKRAQLAHIAVPAVCVAGQAERSRSVHKRGGSWIANAPKELHNCCYSWGLSREAQSAMHILSLFEDTPFFCWKFVLFQSAFSGFHERMRLKKFGISITHPFNSTSKDQSKPDDHVCFGESLLHGTHFVKI